MASPQHERAASAASEKGDMSFNASVEYRKSSHVPYSRRPSWMTAIWTCPSTVRAGRGSVSAIGVEAHTLTDIQAASRSATSSIHRVRLEARRRIRQ